MLCLLSTAERGPRGHQVLQPHLDVPFQNLLSHILAGNRQDERGAVALQRHSPLVQVEARANNQQPPSLIVPQAVEESLVYILFTRVQPARAIDEVAPSVRQEELVDCCSLYYVL